MKISAKLRSIGLIITIFLVGVLYLSTGAYATEERTVVETDTISCVNDTDAVAWTLYSDGELVFSGSGTTGINLEYGWFLTWRYFDKSQVTSVSVEPGSNIVVNTADLMFSQFENCKSIDLSGMDFSQATGMLQMFYRCMSLESLNITGMKTNNVTSMKRMFEECEKLTKLDISGFDTRKVTDMSYMFCECSQLTELNLNGLKTNNVTDMSSMFAGCRQLTALDVSEFNTSKVTDMEEMFYNCVKIPELNVSGFETGNVTNMNSMFSCCNVLAALNVGGFETGNVTDMSDMFTNCYQLTELNVSGFDTGKVENMSDMFSYCSVLETLDVSGFKTENVTNMACMFGGCEKLTELAVAGFETSLVTDMTSMFSGCSSLTTLDVSNFVTDNVTNMSYMFYDCSDLTTLDVSQFNTAHVTSMLAMFYYCDGLTELNVKNFVTTNVTNMSAMFSGCSSLQVLDVSDFDTSNVRNMSNMFYNCRTLSEIDVSGFHTDKVSNMLNMFRECKAVEELNLSQFDTANVTNMSNMFYNCNALKTLDLSSFDTSKLTSNFPKIKGSSLETLISPKTTSNFTIETDSKIFYYDDADGGRHIFYGNSHEFTNCEPLTTIYFIPSTLPINYVYEGELVDCALTYSVEEGLSSLGSVALEHYTFDGWYTDSTYTTEITSIESGTIEEPTLYAKMIPDTYSITYENTEQALSTNSLPTHYNYGFELVLPDLEGTCYAFDGWYTDKELEEPIETISAGSFGNVTLYAKWTLVHETYVKNVKEPTCTETGYSGDVYCLSCERMLQSGKELETVDHDSSIVKSVVEPTCTIDGYSGDHHCKWCDKLMIKGEKIACKGHDVDRENGKVITPATSIAEGIIEYKCKNCDYTEKEPIAKVSADIPKEDDIPKKDDIIKEDALPEQTPNVTDETILSMLNDDDIEGSSFALIQAKADKTTKNSIRLKWNKVTDADGYKIYGNKCGKKNKYKYITTITNGNTTKFIQKNLKKGTYYKYIVRAYKLIDGQEVTIAVSKTIHASTTGGKYGNAKSVKLKTNKKLKKKSGKYTLTIKMNKKYTVKASEIKQSKKIDTHRRISYESSDTSIATVKNGVIKAVCKGTCYIYAYAQNGAYAKIKVTVK